MYVLFIIKVEILVPIEWSCRSSQLCRILSVGWLSSFEHGYQIFFRHMCFWYLFLELH